MCRSTQGDVVLGATAHLSFHQLVRLSRLCALCEVVRAAAIRMVEVGMGVEISPAGHGGIKAMAKWGAHGSIRRSLVELPLCLHVKSYLNAGFRPAVHPDNSLALLFPGRARLSGASFGSRCSHQPITATSTSPPMAHQRTHSTSEGLKGPHSVSLKVLRYSSLHPSAACCPSNQHRPPGFHGPRWPIASRFRSLPSPMSLPSPRKPPSRTPPPIPRTSSSCRHC